MASRANSKRFGVECKAITMITPTIAPLAAARDAESL